MDGAKGSALEWALALLHAPGKRHALRQKPLPDGMDGLLGIAAGAAPDELAEAARTFGEPEARIREAAQFYVREVLFFPQADAYRVLGVGADASDASIKAHHRLLQHWLHPDRLQSEDDAIFATRVNVAWNRLRNRERRQAYDKALQEEEPQEAFEGSQALGSVHAWIPDAEITRNPWRHRLPVLLLSGACVLLVVLVLRDMDGRQEGWEGVSSDGPGLAAEGGFGDISIPRDVANVAPDRARGGSGAVVSPATPIAAPAPVAASAPPMPLIEFPPLTPLPVADDAAVAQAVVVPAPVPAPLPAPLQASMVTREAPGAASQPAAPRVSVDAPAEYVAPARVPQPVAQTPKQAQAKAQPLPSYARIRQAWAAGDQLLRFMGGIGQPPPPIWSSPGIQSSADLLRQDMHGAGRVRLSGPEWQIGEKTAVLTSGYAVQGKDDGAGTGNLTADLVWRDDRWLVVGLSIERTQ
jgi:hypothetical protein